MNTKKGVVFIVVLGVLVLLVLLGVTFSLLTRIERSSSEAYMNQIRAKLIAQSGIETAIAQLRSDTAQFPEDAIYWGEDTNKNGKLDTGEDQNKNGRLDTGDCPIEYALRPSFAAMDDKNNLKSIQFKNRKCGYSGDVPSVTGGSADNYALKLIDCNSLIYINGQGKGTEQLLNNLGTILEAGNDIGTRIVNAREALSTKRFSSKDELKTTLGDTTYQKVAPYLTIYAYINEKVIKPKSLEDRPCRKVEGGKRQLAVGSNVYTWSSLNAGKLELEPRAPINVNNASKPILMAALGNLEGFYLYEYNVPSAPLGYFMNEVSFKDTDNPLVRMGYIASAKIELKALGATPLSMAEQIADKIIEKRSSEPFLSWDDFNTFLKTLIDDNTLVSDDDKGDATKKEARRDILMASANPNSLLNDFNPTKTIWRYVDKSDLSAYTTELCFQPMGYFEIESRGIISVPTATTSSTGTSTESSRRIISDYRIKCLISLWRNEYQTTQKDFAAGEVLALADAKISATNQNKTLQLYPEPDINDYPTNCEYDGNIQLATIQNAATSGVGNEKVLFQTHFSTDFKADFAQGQKDILEEFTEASGDGMQQGTTLQRPQDTRIRKIVSLLDETTAGPGTLHPDGAYCEWGATPTYDIYSRGRGNFPALADDSSGNPRFYGTISFWVKPNYSRNSTRPRIYFSASRPNDQGAEEIEANTDTFEFFAFPKKYSLWNEHNVGQPHPTDYLTPPGRRPEQPQDRLIWFWEIDQDDGAKDQYIITQTKDLVITGSQDEETRNQWMHVAVLWDSTPPLTATEGGTISSRPDPACSGQGTSPVNCPTCSGNGTVTSGTTQSVCGTCAGSGTYIGTRPIVCTTCRGTGSAGTTTSTITCPQCSGARTVTNTPQKTCPQCNGARTTTQACGQCGGSGQASCGRCGGSGQIAFPGRPQMTRPCPACSGTGKQPCPSCRGTGTTTVSCPGCGGRGTVADTANSTTIPCPGCNGSGTTQQTTNRPCPPCNGTGSTGTQPYNGPCPSCGGAGSISRPNIVDCPNCVGGQLTDSSGKYVTTPCGSCGGTGTLLSPDIQKPELEDVFAIYIDGTDNDSHSMMKDTFDITQEMPDKYADFLSGNNYIRLGERYGMKLWNYGADATIDEFTIQQHASVESGRLFADEDFKTGRYYKGEGKFTSGLIEVPMSTTNISSIKASVTWTVYYPTDWDTKEKPVEIQFFDESGSQISDLLNNPQGSEFNISVKADGTATKIKYKIYFRGGEYADLNSPLLESPVFDDINIKFIYPEPTILKWTLN